jgi:predicted nucleotidyltransferase
MAVDNDNRSLRDSGSHPMDSQFVTTIRGILERHPGIRLAILFGSFARGAVRSDSDLDVAVDVGRPLTAEEKIKFTGDLAQEIGRPVDLVDLNNVGEPLLGQIIVHGRRLLGSDTRYAELIRRHLFDQADFMPYRSRILAERRRRWIGK